MARRLRLESEAGVYHVLNRGNYRAHLFRSDSTKMAFLKCVGETCERTGWLVHAWCIMSNHYHLAISTPRANLVEGMCWLQGTFAARFNRCRREHGHLFQGRYKSLIVDPDAGQGPLCHYIHLNPVRAHLCVALGLNDYEWTSALWLFRPSLRPDWYDPVSALRHAGGLSDTPAGRHKYLEYLAWLAENEPARKQQRFEAMSRGWIVGAEPFARAIIQEHDELVGHGPRLAVELREAREAGWQEHLERELRRLRRKPDEIVASGKSEPWKLAVAAALKARTTVTNRWLSEHLRMGNHHEVSRKVSAWIRNSAGKAG